jgi:hypothetical protein
LVYIVVYIGSVPGKDTGATVEGAFGLGISPENV